MIKTCAKVTTTEHTIAMAVSKGVAEALMVSSGDKQCCFHCGGPGHFVKDCPEHQALKDLNHLGNALGLTSTVQPISGVRETTSRVRDGPMPHQMCSCSALPCPPSQRLRYRKVRSRGVHQPGAPSLRGLPAPKRMFPAPTGECPVNPI